MSYRVSREKWWCLILFFLLQMSQLSIFFLSSAEYLQVRWDIQVPHYNPNTPLSLAQSLTWHLRWWGWWGFHWSLGWLGQFSSQLRGEGEEYPPHVIWAGGIPPSTPALPLPSTALVVAQRESDLFHDPFSDYSCYCFAAKISLEASPIVTTTSTTNLSLTADATVSTTPQVIAILLFLIQSHRLSHQTVASQGPHTEYPCLESLCTLKTLVTGHQYWQVLHGVQADRAPHWCLSANGWLWTGLRIGDRCMSGTSAPCTRQEEALQSLNTSSGQKQTDKYVSIINSLVYHYAKYLYNWVYHLRRTQHGRHLVSWPYALQHS